MDASIRMDSLLFALLAEAVADIRRIREAHQGEVKPEIQRRKFEAWERGQIVSSAGFLLDFSRAWNLPDGAVKLSYSVLQVEEPYLDELVAASVAGIPWRHEFPNACMRCGKPGSWRPILNPPPRRTRGNYLALPATGECHSDLPSLHGDARSSAGANHCNLIWSGDCGVRALKPSGNGIEP